MECILFTIKKERKEREKENKFMTWQSGIIQTVLSCLVFKPCQLTFTLHSYRASYIIQLLRRAMFNILIMTEVWQHYSEASFGIRPRLESWMCQKPWVGLWEWWILKWDFFTILYLEDYVLSSLWVHIPFLFLPQLRSTWTILLSNIGSIHCHQGPELDTVQHAEKANPSQGVMKQCLPVFPQVPNNPFLEKCSSIALVTVPNDGIWIPPWSPPVSQHFCETLTVCQDSDNPWIMTVLHLKHRSNPIILQLPFCAKQTGTWQLQLGGPASLAGLLQVAST